jgi:hypothetical protein
MKYVFLLVTVAAVYFFLMRKAPVAPVVSAVTEQEAAPLTTGPRAETAPAGGSGASSSTPAAPANQSNFLKRPLDRTNEVLKQVKGRNGDGEF